MRSHFLPQPLAKPKLVSNLVAVVPQNAERRVLDFLPSHRPDIEFLFFWIVVLGTVPRYCK